MATISSEFDIIRVSRDGLLHRLREYETLYATHHGAQLSSSEFYAGYVRGKYDTPFAMAWATYCEALERIPAQTPTAR